MEIGPHLHRIGNDIVAAYLVTIDEAVSVVDAGLMGHWPDLVRELEVLGRPSPTSAAWCSPLDASWVLPGHGTPWQGDLGEVQDGVRRAAR